MQAGIQKKVGYFGYFLGVIASQKDVKLKKHVCVHTCTFSREFQNIHRNVDDGKSTNGFYLIFASKQAV